MKTQKPFDLLVSQIFHSIEKIEAELQTIKSLLPLNLENKKTPKNLLVVTSPNGNRIEDPVQANVLMQALEEMGFENVEPHAPEITKNLTAALRFHGPRYSENGEFAVETALSVDNKRKLLVKLARKVPGDWKVEVTQNK